MRLIRVATELEPLRGGVFVPTMGALHEGHASLVRLAAAEAQRDAHGSPPGARPVVVSIFVNPTQFNDPADLARYPRTLDADLALCAAAGATAVFAPDVQTVYPAGERSDPAPALPAVATEPGLEDRLRPGHFAGVHQVVARLFDLVQPQAAVFGEKDWQQLQVVSALAASRTPQVRIVPGPTLREPDGLAMSSRNRFLPAAARAQAAAVSAALRAACREHSPREAESAMRRTLDAAGLEVEYAVVRDAATLLEPQAPGPWRALVAARLAGVRLIDNAPWTPGAAT